MDGWLRVPAEAVTDDAELARWVRGRRGASGVTPAEVVAAPLRTRGMKQRLLYALFGVLATLVGVATGHLVASLLNPASSPVLAVGSQVIDLTPTPMKEWAIRQFGDQGQADPDRVGHGRRARAGRGGRAADAHAGSRYGAGLLVVLVAVAGFTAMNRPAAELVDLVPSIAAALAGVGALWLPGPARARAATDAAATPRDDRCRSRRPRRPRAAACWSPPASSRRPRSSSAAPGGSSGPTAPGWPTSRCPSPPTRRPRSRPASRSRYQDITPFRIANDDFYRVDTRLDVPIIDQRRVDPDHRRRRRAGGRRSPSRTSWRCRPDRAGHHAHLRLQQRRREVRRRRPLARRPAHRPARPGRRRQRGRPDLRHRLRRHDDQHAAGPGHRRPRRDARRRHERRGAAPRARLPGPDRRSPASTASSAPPSGSPGSR